jgi:hypothetical protein
VREADHSPPSSAVVKEYLDLQYASMALCSVKVQKLLYLYYCIFSVSPLSGRISFTLYGVHFIFLGDNQQVDLQALSGSSSTCKPSFTNLEL